MNKKIAIISEHHRNDGESIAVLLQQYCNEQIEFVQFCTRYTGSRIQSKEALLDLKLSFKREKPDFVIVIRDLDKDDNKIQRKVFFEQCQTTTNDNAIYLLFVYMLEALALADFSAVCNFYSINKNTISINKKARNAKEELRNAFSYTESDMRGLVEVFDINTLQQNYGVWADFLSRFEQKLLEY